MDTLIQDVRYALRQLRRNPGFTAVAIVTLALGIGANTAIFSVVNAVLLRPLPYPQPDRLVRVYEGSEDERWTVSPPNFVDWRRQSEAFEEMAAFHSESYALTGEGAAERVSAARVTSGFFPVLGVSPALGRRIMPEEAAPGRDRVVVLSHGLWQRRFGSDPDAVGRTVELDGESYDIVGVMPPGFEYPAGAEMWTPRSFTAEDLTTQRGAHYLSVIARLAPGVTKEEASAEMRAIAARLAAEYAETNAGWSASVEGLHVSIVGDVRSALLILLGAVGLVLLIACVNVANLSLARAVGRERELAIRSALGAGRVRIARGLLTESVLLGLAGGAVGLLLALWGTDILVGLQAEQLPRIDEVSIDRRVLGFALAASLITGVLFGLAPALRGALRHDPVPGLKEGGRGGGEGRRGGRLRSGLVVGEIALAVLLLAGAGLLARSFLQLQRVDPGFDPTGVLTFSLELPDARYPEPATAEAFYDELLERIEAVPGAENAAAVFGLPLTHFSYVISVEELDGRPAYEEPGEESSVQVRLVTPDYFRVMGIPLRDGRGISETDGAGAPPVVVVNESAARLLWPGEDPIGHTLRLGTSLGLDRGNLGGEVVGVVADTREYGPAGDPRPQAFFAHRQFPEEFMSVVAEAADDPHALVGPIRERLRAMDPDLPLSDLQTMEERMAASVAQPRFYMILLGLFAAIALILAAVGIYGVVAYGVRQRTREIGIRVAMGARRPDVLRLVLRRGAILALAGAGLGLAGALALTRTLSDLIYDLSPRDPVTLLVVAALLTGVAVLACYIPARRATEVDPMVALRAE